jgi:asparagine synthase (glutamine-hydrolysing)
VTKVLLREMAATLLPQRFLDRPKYGFAAPIDGWFRSDLAGVYRDTVLAPDARGRDHLDQAVAASLLADHLAGRTDQSRRLWLLLAFELWARQWSTAS